jgi:OmpA-OmpF porin, OOP family
MKKTALFFLLCSVSVYGLTQSTESYIRPAALGFSYNLFDFTTPQRIQASSLSTVLREKQTAHLKDMGTGLAVSYFKGLRNKVDFAGTFAVASADYTLPNTTSTPSSDLLMEADASLQFKMLPDKYFFLPYLSAGLGASKYGVYYGAFMPLGVGFRLNFFDEAALFVNARYHVPVTDETVRGHFVYGFGIAGIVGSRKNVTTKPAP